LNNVVITVDAGRAVATSLLIAGGSLVKINAANATNPIQIFIHPVGDSRMRDTIAKVTLSRRNVFGTYLTYPAALLSPAFECYTDNTIISPYRVPIGVSATIDMNRYPMYQDVCLAFIYYIPSVNFAAWKCIDRTDDARVADPVRTAAGNSTDPASTVTGILNSCNNQSLIGLRDSTLPTTGIIYGFVLQPARAVDLNGEAIDTFWADNIVYIVLGICGFGAITMGVVYFGKRLHRYRTKYHQERKDVEKMGEEVNNMEQFGGQAGNKDEQLEMMANPMVVQAQQLQARLDSKNEEVMAEEAVFQEKASEARQEHIQALQTDRNALEAELEALKQQLELQNPRIAAVARASMSRPATKPATAPVRAAKKAPAADFQTGRPGARKKNIE
jgi:hypothetical protein